MKFFFIFILFYMTGHLYQCQKIPEIDFVITNDYMSARNLYMMGGVLPAGYNKGLKDSLENSFVEYFKDGNIVDKKLYNSIGAIYYSEKYLYDAQTRLEKIIKTNEFNNESCEINFKYSDTLKLFAHRTVNNLCNKETKELFYKYNAEGKQTEILTMKNGVQETKDEINSVSKIEITVKNTDKENRISTYIFKYNDKNLISYEQISGWDYVQKPDYYQTDEKYEYTYQYDQYGTWIERIKKTYCEPEKKKTVKKKKASANEVKELPSLVRRATLCQPEIREKLIRKIYYKK